MLTYLRYIQGEKSIFMLEMRGIQQERVISGIQGRRRVSEKEQRTDDKKDYRAIFVSSNEMLDEVQRSKRCNFPVWPHGDEADLVQGPHPALLCKEANEKQVQKPSMCI